MRSIRFVAIMLAFLVSSLGSLHAQPLALCTGARVVMRSDPREISVTLGKKTLIGRIDYAARGKYSRVINASCVRTTETPGIESCDISRMTIALIDEDPKGLLVITSKGRSPDEWSYFNAGEFCPVPSVIGPQDMNKLPVCSARDIAKIAAESDMASAIDSPVWLSGLGLDDAKTFCEENRRNAIGRIRIAQAVADFMAHRKKYKSSSREDEIESTPQLAMELYSKCYHIRHLGIFMHGSGLMLFPQFASAGCYASLLPVFDPSK